MKTLLFGVFSLFSLSAFAQTTGTVRLMDSGGAEVIAYEGGDTAYVRVVDADRNADSSTAETLDVTLSSAVEATEVVTLTETGVNTGIFEGTFTFEAAATETASDGILQIETGKQLTASYDDPADDFGNPKTVSDTAFFDVTLVTGTLSNNTTWRKDDSPFLVTGDVTVQNGAKLTIEPGVEVRFLPAQDDQSGGEDTNRSELIVYGEISAIGAEADSIRFVSNSNTPAAGDWYGIRLRDQGAKGKFAYGVFADATYGIHMQSLYGNVLDTVRVAHSHLTRLGTGLYNNDGYRFYRIEDNRFDQLGSAIQFQYAGRQGSALVQSNTIQSESGNGIYFYYYDRLDLVDNNLIGNSGGTGIRLQYNNRSNLSNNHVTSYAAGFRQDGDNQDTLTAYGNTFIANQSYGMFLNGLSAASIRQNTLQSNGQYGLRLERTSARVDSNTVTANLQDGIWIYTNFETPVTDSLLYNTITGNGGDGIEIADYARPVLNYNNIHSNVGYDVNNRSPQHPEVDARFNWWGDNNTAVMNTGGNPKNLDKIYDQFDEPAIGFVNYGGWLSEENGTPVAASSTGTVRLMDSGGSEVIAYEGGDTAYVRVVDADRNADSGVAETLDVTLSSAVEAAEVITLTETGANTGIFEATFTFEATATATASDGILQIETGKQLTASYDDPADDFGNPKTVSDTAFFDVTLVTGTLSNNTTWRKDDSPFLVTGDVTVQNGAKLTIEPGVEVRFLPAQDDQSGGEDTNRSELIVYGEISAIGAEADSIRFVSNSNTPAAGDWYGIRLRDQGAKGKFAYGVFADATYGIHMQSLYGNVLDTVRVAHSHLTRLGTGLYNNDGYRFYRIEDNRFDQLGSAIQFQYAGRQGSALVQSNTIQSESGNGIYFYYYDRLDLVDNNLIGNSGGTGIRLQYNNRSNLSNNHVTSYAAGFRQDGDNQDTLTAYGNTFIANQSYGMFLNGLSAASIRQNTLQSNGQYGLRLERTSARVDSNTVTANLQDGIWIYTNFETPVTDSLLYNTITGNGGDGIEIADYARPVLNYNNIHSNVGYDVNNRSPQHPEVDARFNWWGDNNTAVMNTGGNPKNLDKIYDQFDEPAIGFVNYAGWLSEENGTPVAASSTGTVRLMDSGGSEVIAYEGGDTAYVRVVDADRNADSGVAETLDVTLSSAVEAAEVITLTETGVNTGIFEGTFTFEAAATETASDGILQIETGKQLTASYDDPADDFGNPKTVSDTAFFDVTLVTGTLSNNTTWRKDDSPFLVTGDVTVQNGAKLTIEPGVEVRFLPAQDDQSGGEDTNRSELIVYGEISAIGAEADSIRFVSNSNTPAAGDWYGIRLRDQGAKGKFAYGVFADATYGIHMQSLYGNVLDTVRVAHSHLTRLGTGLYNNDGYRFYRIEDNRFDQLGSAIQFQYAGRQGSALVQSNTIQSESGNGIYFYYYDRLDLVDNNLIGNSGGTGIRLQYNNRSNLSNNHVTSYAAGFRQDGDNQDTLTAYGNTFIANQSYGMFLNGLSAASIRQNTLQSNGQYGLRLERTSARVDSNTVTANLQDGIWIYTNFETPVTDSLLYNTITGNGGDGIEIADYARPVLNYNNIHSNVGYDVNNRSPQHPEVDARFNWWGDNNTAVMNTGGNPKNLDKIYDQFDEPAIGFVNYGGWLSEEVDISQPPPPPTTPSFAIDLLVSDIGSHSATLSLGVAPGASDGYEEELDLLAPPPAPGGTFDARVRASVDFLTDIRSDAESSHTWTLIFQAAAGQGPVTLSWDPALLPEEGSFRLRDPFGGSIVNKDMRLADSYQPPDALTQLVVAYRAQEEVELSLQSGWNIVGAPLATSDMDYLALFPEAQARTLFAFAGNYVIPDPPVLDPGAGYWLRFAEDSQAIIQGNALPALNLDLQAGWNLIAGPSCTIALASVTDPAGIIVQGTLFSFSGSYSASTDLSAGSGYWIRAAQAGSIGMDCANASKGSTPIDPLAGFTQVRIADARSTDQTLYLGGAFGETLSEYAYTAPPPAPGNGMRALFSRGRYVQPSSTGLVSLSGATFPLEITVTGTATLVGLSPEGTLGSWIVNPGETLMIADPLTTQLQISLGAHAETPQSFSLEQNYPNPFNPITTIRFALPEASPVTLEVFDALGRRVAALLQAEQRPAGWHTIPFDAQRLTSGTYFYRIQAGDHRQVKRMILLK